MHEFYKVDISDDEELATSHRESKEGVLNAKIEHRSQNPLEPQAVMVVNEELNITRGATGSAQAAGLKSRLAEQEEVRASRNQHKLLTKIHSMPNE